MGGSETKPQRLLFSASTLRGATFNVVPTKIARPIDRELLDNHEHQSIEMASLNCGPSSRLLTSIVTGHPTMPQYSFDANQVGDFIAFLKTLE